MSAEIISKITMKTVGAQPAPRSVTKKEDLVRIYGRADRVSEGSTTYGIFHKYKGDFKAVNLITGEAFRSGTLLLPEIADPLLLNAMLAAGATLGKEKTAKTPEVEGEKVKGEPIFFGLIIGVIPQESADESGRGYQYTVKEAFESQVADPFAAIEEKMVKAIAGPSSSATPAQTPGDKGNRKK
ncbi:MAG: hypothetical protein ACP5QA_10400 [Phycisphaerae bacterium]